MKHKILAYIHGSERLRYTYSRLRLREQKLLPQRPDFVLDGGVVRDEAFEDSLPDKKRSNYQRIVGYRLMQSGTYIPLTSFMNTCALSLPLNRDPRLS